MKASVITVDEAREFFEATRFRCDEGQTLSKLFTAGRGRQNSYGLDVVMLIHEMFASRTNGKFIRQNVKFIFVFSGANYEKIADTYCRSYGGKKRKKDKISYRPLLTRQQILVLSLICLSEITYKM